MEPTLSTAAVMEMTGATGRQLDYWARTGALVPAIPARGSGTHRRYTTEQAVLARILMLLSGTGATGHVLAHVARATDLPDMAYVAPSGGVLPLSDVLAAGGPLGAGWVCNVAEARAHVLRRAPLTLVA